MEQIYDAEIAVFHLRLLHSNCSLTRFHHTEVPKFEPKNSRVGTLERRVTNRAEGQRSQIGGSLKVSNLG